jgi:hypothetical protein
MSLKWLLLVAALVAGFVAVARTEPPVDTAASASSDSSAVTEVAFSDRLRYSVGSVGTAMVAGTVRRGVFDTERSLAELGKSIKDAKGSDGMRARDIARKIKYADSLAVEHLYYGRPVQAVRQTMEAKSLLNAVKRNLKQQI